MDRAFSGGHAVVAFDGCRVPADAVLGEAGLGYRYAQVRLAPARLTHCMRWLGLARRALDIALDTRGEREAFGAPLLEQGMVQALVADSVIDIEASRGLIRTCAEVLDAGGRGTHESSVAKVFVSEAVGPRRRPLDADLRRPRRERRPAAGALRARGARVPDLRRAERDAPLVDRAARRAPPPARAVSGPVDVVDTPAQAAALPLPPLVVRRPLEAWLDEHGLGSGPARGDAHRRGPLERDVPARARRRAHGAAPGAAPAAAALGARHAARGARAARARTAARACRACSPCARTPTCSACRSTSWRSCAGTS